MPSEPSDLGASQSESARTGAPSSPLLRVATRDVPPRKRLSFLREVFGREICGVDIETLSDDPIDYEATMLGLPGLRVMWMTGRSAACWDRTAEFVKDGNDDFMLALQLEGTLLRSQRGIDLSVSPGEAAGILHTEPASLRHGTIKSVSLAIPRTALSPLVRHMDDASSRLILRNSEAISLLRAYVSLLRDTSNVTDPALGSLMATHVHDLVAMAIGANADGEEIAIGRGIRAARLKAITSFVIGNLDSQALSVGTVASHFKLTPRYVHMLFEGTGLTFSGFVIEQRLLLALRMLRNVRHAGMSISAIAFAAGFSDLSHFNRSFRRRFGARPTDMRLPATR